MLFKRSPGNMRRQTFLLLFCGFILMQVVSLTVYGLYYRYRLHNPERIEIANHIVQLITVANIVPRFELQHIIAAVDNPQLHLNISDQPLDHALQISTQSRPLFRRNLLHHAGNHLRMSVRLPDGGYLNIQAIFEPWHWLVVSAIVFILLALLAMAFLLSAWAVRRLTLPLAGFVYATQRLGQDVNAPPLIEQGPIEIRYAILAFNEMQQKIQQLIHNRTQMLAAISHDLRTPITRLKLRAELFSDSPQYPKILADLSDMEQMIQATLSFIRDDHQTEKTERFDLDALLETLCNDLSDSGHAITYHAFGARLPFAGRSNALKRALNNLLENAVKYGITVDVKIRQENQQIIIEINDQGPGIPEAEFSKVFEPFYRLERSRSRETGGVGLGLAIARDIIRSHGGEIQLCNRAEGGLQVSVLLKIEN